MGTPYKQYSRQITDKDLQELKETLYTKDGLLFAKYKYSRKTVLGKPLGSTRSDGYSLVQVFGKRYYVHRVVYFLTHNNWPTVFIDHINGDPSDNRPENLREVDHGWNIRSSRVKSKGTSSKYRGVHWSSSLNVWICQTCFKGKRSTVGKYTCEEEAALAWNYKVMQLGFNPESYNKVF